MKIIRHVFFILLISTELIAGHSGTDALPFLRLSPGAKEGAMGQTGVALTHGAESLYWNPAHLGITGNREVFVSHSLFLEDTSVSYFSMSWPLRHHYGAGLSVNYFDAGTVPQTDAIGQTVGSLAPRDFLVSTGFSFPLRRFRFGLSGKYIQSKIIHTAHVWTFDAGGIFPLNRKWVIGAVCQNASGHISYVNENEVLPRLVRVGVSRKSEGRFLVSMEEVFSRTDEPYLAAGSEYRLTKSKNMSSFVRVGFNEALQRDKNSFAGFTLGGGLQWVAFDLDYSWVPMGDLGQTQVISMNFRWR